MDIETKAHLSDETIDNLQTLIRYNIDSFDGFNESAEEIDDARIAQLFRDIANERSEFATELQHFVEYNGEEPVETGSIAAACIVPGSTFAQAGGRRRLFGTC